VVRASLGPGFRRLITASAMSNLADGVFQVALPLLALRLTDSPALVSGVALASKLPWLLFALQAGALADRLDRKRTMLTVDVCRGALIALLGVLVIVGREQLWVLYVIAFALGIGETLFDTAAQSVLPSVVGADGLDRANGRLQAVEITTNSFIGPPIGGLLAGIAISSAFLGSAACYLIAPLVLVGMRGSFRPERTGPARAMRHDIAEGLRYLLTHKVLRTMAVMVGVMNLASAASTAVLPLYAVKPGPLGLSDAGYGLLLTAFAIGYVVGSLLVAPLVERIGRSRTLFLAVAAFAVQTGVFLLANVYAIFVIMLLASTVSIGWNVITVSLRQRIVPDHLLGRVNSAYRLLAWGTMPIGALVGGVLGELFGLRSVFAFGALLTLTTFVFVRTLSEAALTAAEAEAQAALPGDPAAAS
jgi:MFS family permease